METTCFVCGDDNGADVVRVCDCTTVVHRACFESLVRKVPSHAERCPICTSTYEVVKKSTRTECGLKPQMRPVLYAAALWVYASALLFFCFTSLLRHVGTRSDVALALFALLGMLSFASLRPLVGEWMLFLESTGGWSPWHVRRVYSTHVQWG